MDVIELKNRQALLAGSIGLVDTPVTPPTPGTTLAPEFEEIIEDF